MAFADQHFHERFKVRGQPCETAFESWATEQDVHFVRYGFDDPPFRVFADLPSFIRVTPDYVCEGKKHAKFFIECKGCGGRVLKIKLESMEELVPWNEYLTVWFFVFNSRDNTFALVNYRQMSDLCQHAPVKHFSSDNKPYYHLTASKFNWRPLKETINETN